MPLSESVTSHRIFFALRPVEPSLSGIYKTLRVELQIFHVGADNIMKADSVLCSVGDGKVE